VFERSSELSDPAPLQEGLTALLNHAKISHIAKALERVPMYSHAFLARVDKDQDHCSWPFNPMARRNLRMAALSDEDFSRAIQIATLRPITLPRMCECKAVIDPVGLHLLHCQHVHFGHLHDCIKTALVATCKSFQPLDLASVSVLMEKPVARFYPLKHPLLPEGPLILADIVVSVADTVQQVCVIADVSSVLSRGPSISLDFHAALRARSQAKRLKYSKYDIPSHLFHPVTVGRTNVISRDALLFCDFIGKHFPTIPKAADLLRAAISRAICVGAARTLSTAIRRSQLAAINAVPCSKVLKSAACSHFTAVTRHSDGVMRLRDAEHDPLTDVVLSVSGASRVFRPSRCSAVSRPSRPSRLRSAACSFFADVSRPDNGVVRWRNVVHAPLSACPCPLVVSAVNGLPHQLGALQDAAVVVDSSREFTVSVGVVDR
jgi:hypothetical protein